MHAHDPADDTIRVGPPARAPNESRDVDGRLIKFRTLGVLDQMKLIRSVGRENVSYYNLCLKASRVASIDGEHFPIPERREEFEYVVERLGDGGFVALNDFIRPKEDLDNARKSDKERKEAVEAALTQDRELTRKLVEHPGFVAAVGLITSGVSAEIVFGPHERRAGLDHIELAAWTIAAGIADGAEWSWSAWRWMPREPQQ